MNVRTPQPRSGRQGRSRRHERGLALMMVMTVIAAASILAWAMLSASSMRSQIDANALDTAEAMSLSESGASYAMHALKYPEKFRPTAADAATWFYPGELGLLLWPDARGTVDITVTSTGADTRRIRSTATVVRPGATTGTKHTTEVDVTCIYQGIIHSVGLNSDVTIPATGKVHIVGPVVAKGVVTNPQYISGSPALVPTGANTVPTAAEVRLLVETGTAATGTGTVSTDRTYTYNGNTYVAEKAPATIGLLGLSTSRPSLNPCNVWWSETNVKMDNATFTGVLVLRGTASLAIANSVRVTAPSGMPALVIAKKIDMKSGSLLAAHLDVTGAVWLGDKLFATAPDNSNASINIDGALLWGDPAAGFSLSGTVDITYKASAVAALTEISTIKTIGSLKVTRWQSVD